MLLLLISLAFSQDAPLPAFEALLPETPSFQTAKKRVYELQIDRPVTFYCTCKFEDKVVDLKSCLMGDIEAARALRTEVEHVVPASVIGKTRDCWAEGGRDHCLKVDPVFRTAHNDLHNLRIAVGHVNGQRSNRDFGYVEGEERVFGACDFEINFDSDLVEPTPAIRGDIARTYQYMEFQYGVALTEGQRRLFLHWSAQDPVDSWERERDRRIEERQGNFNPFVR